MPTASGPARHPWAGGVRGLPDRGRPCRAGHPETEGTPISPLQGRGGRPRGGRPDQRGARSGRRRPGRPDGPPEAGRLRQGRLRPRGQGGDRQGDAEDHAGGRRLQLIRQARADEGAGGGPGREGQGRGGIRHQNRQRRRTRHQPRLPQAGHPDGAGDARGVTRRRERGGGDAGAEARRPGRSGLHEVRHRQPARGGERHPGAGRPVERAPVPGCDGRQAGGRPARRDRASAVPSGRAGGAGPVEVAGGRFRPGGPLGDAPGARLGAGPRGHAQRPGEGQERGHPRQSVDRDRGHLHRDQEGRRRDPGRTRQEGGRCLQQWRERRSPGFRVLLQDQEGRVLRRPLQRRLRRRALAQGQAPGPAGQGQRFHRGGEGALPGQDGPARRPDRHHRRDRALAGHAAHRRRAPEDQRLRG